MVRHRVVRTALLFAIAGALGAVVSWLLFYFGARLDLLGWALWPTRMLGMGLGELSTGLWMLLMLLNALLFGVFGLFVGMVPFRFIALAWFGLAVVLLAWCAWLSGFALSTDNVISMCGVLAFYSAPFLITARCRAVLDS